jgi:hypothetical protein
LQGPGSSGGLTNFIEPKLQVNAHSSSFMKVHRDHHQRLVFHYRDRNGEVVMQIVLEPEDYL